jgi:septal ring factor EnvC (AmiA/AmiB activator)
MSAPQGQLAAAEQRTAEVSDSLSAVQASIAEKETALSSLQHSMTNTQVDLDKASKQLEDKDAKVGQACMSHWHLIRVASQCRCCRC